jgi:isocitrate lyase
MAEQDFYNLVPGAPAGRFDGLARDYTAADVQRLRGSLIEAHTLAERGANRLWKSLKEQPFIHTLGALSGNQALQMARAGLEAIYLSGWQVAADANQMGMYPDFGLYPSSAGPELCRRINAALQRADQIETLEGTVTRDWFVPVVADGETGFGGPLNVFEITKAYIEAGAAAVHFEDQLATEKKDGHMNGKVLVPTSVHERTLNAARLAADISGVPMLLIARTDAESARLISSDIDECDRPFIEPEGRTAEGYHRLKKGSGLAHCIARSLSYAPRADILWWETSSPSLDEARAFAEAVHEKYPGKLLAYDCTPSFNWKACMDQSGLKKFQRELGEMGYKLQFVSLAGFHSLNHGMFMLAKDYRDRGMSDYSDLQQAEFRAAAIGYTAIRHQHEMGTGYFDAIGQIISGGKSSTEALRGSTEEKQFTSLERQKAPAIKSPLRQTGR